MGKVCVEESSLVVDASTMADGCCARDLRRRLNMDLNTPFPNPRNMIGGAHVCTGAPVTATSYLEPFRRKITHGHDDE